MDRKHLKNMTDEELMVAELLRIIRAERSKPQGDEEAVRDCLDQIAEITGIPRDEVEYTVELKVKEQQTQNRRKKLSRILAGIAVSVAVVMGITACSVNPVFLNWLRTIVRMPVGTSVEDNSITYIYFGEPIYVDSIYDFAKSENISLYYPSYLPDNINLKRISMNTAQELILLFSDPQLTIEIVNEYSEIDLSIQDSGSVRLESENFVFSRYGDHCQAEGRIGENTYIIKYINYDQLTMIVSSLERIP